MIRTTMWALDPKPRNTSSRLSTITVVASIQMGSSTDTFRIQMGFPYVWKLPNLPVIVKLSHSKSTVGNFERPLHIGFRV